MELTNYTDRLDANLINVSDQVPFRILIEQAIYCAIALHKIQSHPDLFEEDAEGAYEYALDHYISELENRSQVIVYDEVSHNG